jgi:hypothetical protein
MSMMVNNVQLSANVFVPTLIYDLDVTSYTGLSADLNGFSQFLSVSNAAFNFTGDFTVEGWYRPTTIASLCTLFTIGAPAFTTGAMVVYFSSGTLHAQSYGGSDITFSGSTMSNNTWYHVALVRSGSTIKLYLNGTANATTITNSSSIGNGTFTVGFLSNGYGYFAGQISTVRVSNSAVYTSNFTPSTSALTTTVNTVTLLPLTAIPFTDSSTNAFTVTNTGTVVPGVQYPFTSTDATGTYTMNITNAGSISWSSTNGGSFAKSNSTGTDYIYGGPNYATGQSYSVFMAYKLSATSAGRLLNTQNEGVKDWLMGAYNGNPNTFYPNFSVNLPSSGADTVWHLDWATWDTSTSTGKLYTSTSTAPSAVAFTATNAGGGGFNQLRLFSRSSGSEVQSGNIAFVKVYNGVLSLSDIQSLHATYKARFGY